MASFYCVHPPYAQVLFPEPVEVGCVQPAGRTPQVLLLSSAPSHFSDHLMLQQSGSRSHISVTFLLSGEVCCSNRQASPLCGSGAMGWILTVLYSVCRAALSALRHLSSHYPHTAIWRHLSQLEAHLLFLQQLSLVQQHTASAMRTQIMLSVTWDFFFFFNPKQQNWSIMSQQSVQIKCQTCPRNGVLRLNMLLGYHNVS